MLIESILCNDMKFGLETFLSDGRAKRWKEINGRMMSIEKGIDRRMNVYEKRN